MWLTLEWFLAGVLVASYICHDMENGTVNDSFDPPEDEESLNAFFCCSILTIIFTEIAFGIWLTVNFFFYLKRKKNKVVNQNELKTLPKKSLKK